MEELKRIIEDAEIMQEDDALWPPPDRVGRQVRVDAAVLFLDKAIGIRLFVHTVTLWGAGDHYVVEKLSCPGNETCVTPPPPLVTM